MPLGLKELHPNDIGKSNLLYALRILLDRSLSDTDLEPRESDFCAFTKNNKLSITLKFTNVDEDCVIAKMREYRSDGGEVFLQYVALRKVADGLNSYSFSFLAGKSMECLTEIQSRYYLKVLNLSYLGSTRDLFSYIRREKKHLLYDAQENRSNEQKSADATTLKSIGKHLVDVNKEVRGLNFVKAATSSLNTELGKLAFHHTKEEVVFDVGATDPKGFTQNLRLATERDERVLEVGGDGRNNQIFMALWSSRNAIAKTDLEFTIHCVEEPEAHLHPHQQRKMAEYLVRSVPGQVLISSHSPQIAAVFSPNSIIRLLNDAENEATVAASEGCSEAIEESLFEFGYRLNAINAEVFYASAVFLVEGPSEILFFRALARQLNIDLDKLNISVTRVDGVGFLPYVKMLNSLEVPWVIRTDNDVSKIPRQDKYRFAGLQRAIDVALGDEGRSKKNRDVLTKMRNNLTGLAKPAIPSELSEQVAKLRVWLERKRIFLSGCDLESDLIGSGVRGELEAAFGSTDDAELLKTMQNRKATSMFEFLREHEDVLKKLSDSQFHRQLTACVELVTGE